MEVHDQVDVEEALKKDKENMGKRYIEGNCKKSNIFLISFSKYNNIILVILVDFIELHKIVKYFIINFQRSFLVLVAK